MRDEQDDWGSAEGGEGRDPDRRGFRIALAGSGDLGVYPDTLIEFLQGLPHDTTILLRRGNVSQPGLFERVMAMAATELWWFGIEWHRPDPNLGREGVYLRDFAMVRSADVVLCYFARGEIEGGTGHVVKAAIDAETPCYAWGLVDGTFVRLGEWDEKEAWKGSMPKP